MKNTLAFFLFGLMAVFAVTGCASLSTDNSPRSNALVRATVQYAVLRAVGEDTSRADRIADIADQAINLAQSGEVTTAERLEVAVRDRIELTSLDPPEQVLADALIQTVRAEIEARIGEQALDADTLVRVLPVLVWVRDTARLAADT